MKKDTREYFARWFDDKGIDDFTKPYVIDVDGNARVIDTPMIEDEYEGWIVKDSLVIAKEIGCEMIALAPYSFRSDFIMYIDDNGMFDQVYNLPMSENFYFSMCIEHGSSRINKEYCHLFGPVFLHFANPIEAVKTFRVPVEK